MSNAKINNVKQAMHPIVCYKLQGINCSFYYLSETFGFTSRLKCNIERKCNVVIAPESTECCVDGIKDYMNKFKCKPTVNMVCANLDSIHLKAL